MIRVFDNKPTEKANVNFTTVNIDGMFRYWTADSMEEFHRWFWDDEYGGPSMEDEVVDCMIYGKTYSKFDTFEKLADAFHFATEILPTDVTVEIIKGTPENVA